MFKQLFSDNRIFIAAVCLLVFLAGGLIYLIVVKSHARRDVQRTQKIVEQLQTPKTERQPAPGGHYHADGTYHVGSHETHAPAPQQESDVVEVIETENGAGLEFIEIPDIPPDPLSETQIQELYAGLPPSAVPENLPEHLKLPQAYKNRYSPDKSDPNAPSITEVRSFMKQVIEYAIANHNPKRPIAEVWPAFMEAEIIYNTLAAQHLGKFPGYTGGSRIEWAYEQFWAFPEVSEVRNSGEYFNSLPTLVYDVEMGLEDPNWNVTTLPDGRTFRMRRNHNYEFKYPGGGYGIEYYRRGDPKHVVIDNVFEISDAELEALSGWNYNFNPYTGKPITLYREPTYVETESGFLTQ